MNNNKKVESESIYLKNSGAWGNNEGSRFFWW